MEILDIINTVLDLSNKGSEYNEAIASLNFTVVTLQQAFMKFEKGKALNDLQMKTMRDLLEEAKCIMQKVSKQSNWWRNLKNMFPGSELSQIKDVNEKIEKFIQVINIAISANGMQKRKHREIESDSESGRSSHLESKKKKMLKLRELPPGKCFIAETLPLDMIKPTMPMEEAPKPHGDAFYLAV
jgi:hypothetical protein